MFNQGCVFIPAFPLAAALFPPVDQPTSHNAFLVFCQRGVLAPVDEASAVQFVLCAPWSEFLPVTRSLERRARSDSSHALRFTDTEFLRSMRVTGSLRKLCDPDKFSNISVSQTLLYHLNCQTQQYNLGCQTQQYNLKCQTQRYNLNCQTQQYNLKCPPTTIQPELSDTEVQPEVSRA